MNPISQCYISIDQYIMVGVTAAEKKKNCLCQLFPGVTAVSLRLPNKAGWFCDSPILCVTSCLPPPLRLCLLWPRTSSFNSVRLSREVFLFFSQWRAEGTCSRHIHSRSRCSDFVSSSASWSAKLYLEQQCSKLSDTSKSHTHKLVKLTRI